MEKRKEKRENQIYGEKSRKKFLNKLIFWEKAKQVKL